MGHVSHYGRGAGPFHVRVYHEYDFIQVVWFQEHRGGIWQLYDCDCGGCGQGMQYGEQQVPIPANWRMSWERMPER